jgi:hypothetical protein
MMVEDMDFEIGALDDVFEFSYSTYLPRIHQDEAPNLVHVDVFDPLRLKNVKSRMDKKIPQGSLLGSGKDQNRIWIEFLGREH